MAEIFHGMSRVLTYDQPANPDSSCLAVNLAMTGVGDVNSVHDALVAAEISTSEGISTIAGDAATEVTINGHQITIGTMRVAFSQQKFTAAMYSQFENNNGLIVPVRLASAETAAEDDSLHFLLVAGYFKRLAQPDLIVVGDSLLDGTQEMPPDQLADRLEPTIDSYDGILPWHPISVKYAAA